MSLTPEPLITHDSNLNLEITVTKCVHKTRTGIVYIVGVGEISMNRIGVRSAFIHHSASYIAIGYRLRIRKYCDQHFRAHARRNRLSRPS